MATNFYTSHYGFGAKHETANHRSNLLRKGASEDAPLIKPQVASNANSTPAVNWRTDISPVWHPSDDPSQWFVTINGEEVNVKVKAIQLFIL